VNGLRLLAGFGDDGRRAQASGWYKLEAVQRARLCTISDTSQHCYVTLNGSMARYWSGREEETSSQQIESRPAKHLTREQLQAINLPFDGALTPGQRDPGLHGGIIRL
jgi:hypothetical protein